MTTRRAIVRRGRARPDDLAVEAPLVLGLEGPGTSPGGEVLATLMRTPGHDLELAAGWLCVESMAAGEGAPGVRGPGDLVTLRACRDDDTDRVLATLRDGVARPRPRAFVTSAACGVCSADVLDLSPLRRTDPHRPGWQVRADVLAALPDALRAGQRVFDRTGGLHAAGLADAAGSIRRVYEDVGRHNAVDKAVGRALLDGELPATDQLLVVSGRVSFELVQKAVAAGVAGLVAVSAPSSLAVDLARDYGLLLAGMVREDGFNLYAGEELVEGTAGRSVG